jgi:hypothetical protein
MTSERTWVYQTPQLNALSYRFSVRTDDEGVGRQVDAALAGLRDHPGTAPAGSWYSLTVVDATGGTIDVTRDGEVLARRQQPGEALAWVVWDVNRAAVKAGAEHLLFHAGAVQADDSGILLPGASGSGKSTLVAGLVRAGLRYLTDELVALNMTSGRLLPYAKPITVKSGSFAALADMGPDACLAPGCNPWTGQEWQVAVGDDTGRGIGTPSVPRFVIAPRFDADAETKLTKLSETQAFFTLAVNAVNLVPHGSVGTRALGRLAGECHCFSLVFSDLEEACRMLLNLVTGQTTRTPGTTVGLAGVGRAP